MEKVFKKLTVFLSGLLIITTVFLIFVIPTYIRSERKIDFFSSNQIVDNIRNMEINMTSVIYVQNDKGEWEEYQRLLRAPGPWMLEHPQELVRELYCKMQTQQLRPRVLVSYVREPYVYAPGNVRVTFDSDIRASLFGRDFAGGSLPGISAADDPGDTVLEVKYDAFLPEIIRALLPTEGLRQQAFSKYGACRRFG